MYDPDKTEQFIVSDGSSRTSRTGDSLRFVAAFVWIVVICLAVIAPAWFLTS